MSTKGNKIHATMMQQFLLQSFQSACYCHNNCGFQKNIGSASINTRQTSQQISKTITENDLIRGRLKVCSKSLVFVPQESSDPSQPDTRPLLKFPLADCTCIEGMYCIVF